MLLSVCKTSELSFPRFTSSFVTTLLVILSANVLLIVSFNVFTQLELKITLLDQKNSLQLDKSPCPSNLAKGAFRSLEISSKCPSEEVFQKPIAVSLGFVTFCLAIPIPPQLVEIWALSHYSPPPPKLSGQIAYSLEISIRPGDTVCASWWKIDSIALVAGLLLISFEPCLSRQHLGEYS